MRACRSTGPGRRYASMVSLSLSVPGSPPRRTDPTRCADRHSPDARLLFQAATEAVAAAPARFPLRTPVAVAIRSAVPLPELEGYSVADAIIEVLVDAGLLVDERLVVEEELRLDPAILTGYSVELANR